MANNFTDDTMRYIVKRIMSNADEAKRAYDNEKTDFSNGLSCAYYEVLDILKSEIQNRGGDLSEFGLDIDIEHKYA